MKPLSIEGIGILCARGRGLVKFENALKEGWVAPTPAKDGRLAHRITDADLKDNEVLKDARRADRFRKMTILAAHDAIQDSGEPLENIRQSMGIIVATA